MHSTTKKIPAEVFAIEKNYLVPVSEYSFAKSDDKSITQGIRKDNTVLYKGNRYRVPVGTYRQRKGLSLTVSSCVSSRIGR